MARESEPATGDAVASVERGRRAKWWRRVGSKRSGFSYVDAKGKRITDEPALERIRSLVIPPAWAHVRISPSAGGKLQAVGIDASGRVQYKYHPAFAARRQRAKFEKIERFGEHLPTLRRTTNQHIASEGLSRERVLAVVIRLINDLYFRVGSERSVKHYRTYGVTTLRNRHLKILPGGRLEFSFVGKHSVRHRRIVVDRELAEIVTRIKTLGGSRLFQYVGSDGKPRPISAQDVNDYIKTSTHKEFSAKDFRTWGGTLLAAVTLAESGAAEDEKSARKNIVRAVERVAEHLGNTPAVCRSSYVHPVIFDRYLAGVTLDEFRRRVERYARGIEPEYSVEELALLKLFKHKG